MMDNDLSVVKAEDYLSYRLQQNSLRRIMSGLYLRFSVANGPNDYRPSLGSKQDQGVEISQIVIGDNLLHIRDIVLFSF